MKLDSWTNGIQCNADILGRSTFVQVCLGAFTSLRMKILFLCDHRQATTGKRASVTCIRGEGKAEGQSDLAAVAVSWNARCGP